MSETKTLCPSCATLVTAKTLVRFNGVCRRCHKQPFEYQKLWIVFALIAVAFPFLAFMMDQELAALEVEGGSRNVNVLIALSYRLAGRTGVLTLFIFGGVVAVAIATRSFRNAQLAKKRNQSARDQNQSSTK